jgi:isopropylmalate/homocitrate/citramalate synthase
VVPLTVVEVGPRDGLQNEAARVSTADKIAFVDRLSAAGLPVIKVTAFVSPTWVPQMADAADVFAGITRRPGTRYSALVPNPKGLERAVNAGATEVARMLDTRGTALANVLAALYFGIRTFDSSAGGLGGCPYAPGAAGNLATEDLLYLLHGLGFDTGARIDAVCEASTAIEPALGHALPSRYVQARRAATAGALAAPRP